MAQKRMFSLSVVDTDKFLEMPVSARLLYYELGMRADDDGFVDNWKKILLFTGLKEDDMKIIAKAIRLTLLDKKLDEAAAMVKELTDKYPIYE